MNGSRHEKNKQTRLEEYKQSRQNVLQTLIDVAEKEVRIAKGRVKEWEKLRDKTIKEQGEIKGKTYEEVKKELEGYVICANCKWVKIKKKIKKGTLHTRAYCEHPTTHEETIPVLKTYTCSHWEKKEKKEKKERK